MLKFDRIMTEPGSVKKRKCPSCGQENDIESKYCWACYAGFDAESKAAKPKPSGTAGAPSTAGPSQDHTVAVVEKSAGAGFKVSPGRIVLAVVLIALCLPYLGDKPAFILIDHVNLAFHEGGHIVFMFFGRFICVTGGTILQLAIPIACAVHFKMRNSELGYQVMLWWTGENLLNISVYVDDARRQELPLVAGGVHDWTYLLEKVGLLVQNEGVARIVFLLGTAIILYSVFLIVRDGLCAKQHPIK